MKRNLLVAVLVLLLSLMMVGCGTTTDNGDTKDGEPQASTAEEIVVTGQETTDDPAKDAQVETASVQLYYISSAYIFDGSDPVNGELMPPIAGTVDKGSYDTIYMATVQTLRALTPIPADQADKYYSMLRDSYQVNSVTVEDGIAYVDFASEGLTGGDLDETLLVDQIVYTLCNSFTEIDAVKFTLDGQNVLTLMGNVDVSEPIVAD